MSNPIRYAFLVSLLLMVIVVEWVRTRLDAQIRSFEAGASEYAATRQIPGNAYTSTSPFCGFAPEPYEQPQRVYLSPRLTEASTRTWALLKRRLDMPFGREAPLCDVVRYLKTATSTNEHPEGLPIFIDPTGLEEAEVTVDSSIQFDVSGLPLEESLRLILAQLGLAFRVEDSGLLVITAELSRDSPSVDPERETLEQIRELRAEVAALRWETAALRGTAPPAPITSRHTMGGIGGGMTSFTGVGSGCR